jgi:predicted dehydrogenase
MTRRQLLHSALGAGAGMALSGSAPAQPKKLNSVRVGIVGVGGRGTGHVRNLLKIPGVEVKATCDIVPSKVENAQNLVEKAGQSRPAAYSNGEFDYRRLCARNDLDAVYIATPWEWHVRMAVEAMKNGKHAFSEVPAATTLEECWELVETAESTGRHCVQLENCCYDRVELMALNMTRKNFLGDVVYAECGYVHDLRATKFSDTGEGQWRLNHALRRNADLYPTHGLGPVAQSLNVNRGNLFDHMVSMASKSASLHEFAARKFGPDSPQAKLDIKLGDVVSSLIRTRAGQTILVVHDTNTPHPYSRKYLLQGTQGILQKYPTPMIHIDGKKGDQWEDLFAVYAQEWEHPLWRDLEQKAQGSGHGGMDYILTYRVMNSLLRGEAPDMDVYDAVALSAVTELSERSIANNSRIQDFPDFTRGRWRSRPPIGIVQA